MVLYEDSILNHLGNRIDCRYLTLACEFYELSIDETEAISNEYINWVQSIVSSAMICAWNADNRATRENLILSKVNNRIGRNGTISFSFEGYLPGSLVTSPSSIRKFQRQRSRMVFPNNSQNLFVSIDYGEYIYKLKEAFREHIPTDLNLLKQAFFNLFQESGKYHYANSYSADAMGSFYAAPYNNMPGKFHGHFSLDISAFCLGSHIEEASDLFLSKLCHFSRRFSNLNGRVMLQPSTITTYAKSPFMRYFGGYRNSDGSHHDTCQTPQEWYPTYYLCGVEWANIISPRTQQHYPDLKMGAAGCSNILHQDIASGGLLLRSLRPIREFDVPDALEMKKLVWQGLYPGRSEWSIKELFLSSERTDWLSYFPRSNWAVVPVFEDEIQIFGKQLVFQSRNYL